MQPLSWQLPDAWRAAHAAKLTVRKVSAVV